MKTPVTTLRTSLMLALALATPLPAFAQWVTFIDQTTLRMPTGGGLNDPATTTADLQQKSYEWGDVDHDGDTDLICMRKVPYTNVGGRSAVLFLNEGIAQGHAVDGVLVDRTIQFATASDAPSWNGQPDMGFLTPTNTTFSVLFDINNDDWLDLITAATLSDNLPTWIGHPRVYINRGTNNGMWLGFRYESGRIPFLGNPTTPNIQPRFMGVAAGDVTGDGYADLYFSDMDSGEVGPPETGFDYNNKLLINMGARNPGYFVDSGTTRMSADPGLSSTAGGLCAITDMNGDGARDVIKLSHIQFPSYLAIQYNDPQNIGFFPDSLFRTVANSAPKSLSVYDLNRDGRMDIVETDDGQDRYFLNTGNAPDGTAQFINLGFTSQIANDGGFNGEARIADLNNDEWPDVISTDVDADTMGCHRRTRIYRNLANSPNVTMQEQSPTVIPTNTLGGVHDVATFDVDGDGWNDLVFGRCNGTQVWRNTTPMPGDTNTDHRVNVDDLLAVLTAWGPCPPPCPADFDHNGFVNVDDLLQVILNWDV